MLFAIALPSVRTKTHLVKPLTSRKAGKKVFVSRSALFRKTYLQAIGSSQPKPQKNQQPVPIKQNPAIPWLAYTINSAAAATRPRWRYLFVLLHTLSPSSPVATPAPKPL